MDVDKETDDYIRESIEFSLGLPVSDHTLRLKLLAAQQTHHCLRHQNLCLHSKLKDKDLTIDKYREESSLNAQALKRFVEENQRLAEECRDLLGQCKKWETECSLYERDREALMDFSNEADQRAKEAEQKLLEAQEEIKKLEEVKKLEEERQFYTIQCDSKLVDEPETSTHKEQQLVESFYPTNIENLDSASIARALFEANEGIGDCETLLNMLNGVSPYALKVLALVAEVKSLQKAKDILRNNLVTAEEEVEALFKENKIIDAENKRIMMERLREKRLADSGGRLSHSAHSVKECLREMRSAGSGGRFSCSASSAKGSKRKSNQNITSDSPVEKRLDYGDADSLRFPLSPLQHSSPEFKLDNLPLQCNSPECKLEK